MDITLIDAMLYAMEGENPSKAIENQERRGQQAVVRKQILPKRVNDNSLPYEIRSNGVKINMEWEEIHKIVTQNNIEYTKQQYERMGITIIDEYDDLFWNVTLPEGWEIKATDHSMWNDLFDNKGRKRANFFYKAAFYDRDAFISFRTRFSCLVDHIADIHSEYEIWKKSDYQGTVKDGEEVIFSTECVPVTGNYGGDDKVRKQLRKKLDLYMAENYPDYKDINSYWD
jgi:hypothetical protein